MAIPLETGAPFLGIDFFVRRRGGIFKQFAAFQVLSSTPPLCLLGNQK